MQLLFLPKKMFRRDLFLCILQVNKILMFHLGGPLYHVQERAEKSVGFCILAVNPRIKKKKSHPIEITSIMGISSFMAH